MGLKAPTPAQTRQLQRLRKAAQLLDSALPIPGTPYRIGLDPIIGVIPVLGDLVSPLFTFAIVWQAWKHGVPRIVVLRMIVNVGIDVLVGAVPLLGDLFDFAWKANSMNLALLEGHATGERTASAGDWFFVGGVLLMLVTIAILPFLLLAWLIGTLFS